MRRIGAGLRSALLVVGLLIGLAGSVAAVDEYGTTGPIPGVSFTGGDGSYKRVVAEGIVLGIVPDFPWTYQDEKTKEYKGLDVSILKEATRRLGITKVSYQIMPFDSLIAALQATICRPATSTAPSTTRPRTVTWRGSSSACG